MSQSDLETWGDALESGQPEGPELELASRLREQRQTTPAMPARLRSELRQNLIQQYSPEAKVIAQIRAARPQPQPMPTRQRLQLRARLLQNYSQPTTVRGKPRLQLGRWQLRLAMTFMLLAVFWSTGTIDAAAQIIEELRNRIFVVKRVPLAGITPTAEPPNATEQALLEAQQTAVARARTVGSTAHSDLQSMQADLPFTIFQPTYLPEDASFETVTRSDDPFSGPGIALRYRMPDAGLIIIYQNKPPQPLQVAVDQNTVVKEATINEHAAVLYNPAGKTSTRKQLMLQWTDGTIWFEISSNLDPDEIIKVAESLKP